MHDHVINARDVNGMTALHMSTRAGHTKCVELLIQRDSDINIMDGEQHIPLFYACANGHPEIVALLLNRKF